MSARRLALVAPAAAFVLTFGVLSLAQRPGGEGAVRRAGDGLALGHPLRPVESTDERIARLQAILRDAPGQDGAYTALAAAFLQKARETGDADLYGRAELALGRALARRPGDPAALTQRASLRLARHEFRAALADAGRALRAVPDSNEAQAVLVDALVELGRYRSAERALQRMIDSKPNAAAYARVGQLRELRGDLPGAVEALDLALASSGNVPAIAAYVSTRLGNVELARGRSRFASSAYRHALARLPGYAPAEAGLARVAQAEGRPRVALRRLRRLVRRLPSVAYTVALGEAQLAAGRRAGARESFALVRAQERLLAVQGVNSDTELALFEAEHGSPRRALALARRAWGSAPSVRSADALGWSLTAAGRPEGGVASRAGRSGSGPGIPGFSSTRA